MYDVPNVLALTSPKSCLTDRSLLKTPTSTVPVGEPTFFRLNVIVSIDLPASTDGSVTYSQMIGLPK